MNLTPKNIPGYSYGGLLVVHTSVSAADLAMLKETAQFTDEDVEHLHLAGDILEDQTKEIVAQWRSEIIASVPNLARHSRDLEGSPLPEYLSASNLRFEQWIVDTCRRPYDQDWINYQQEIAPAPHECRKEQNGPRSFDGPRAFAGHHRLRRRDEQDATPLSGIQRPQRRCSRSNVRGLAEVTSDTDRALGQGLHGPRGFGCWLVTCRPSTETNSIERIVYAPYLLNSLWQQFANTTCPSWRYRPFRFWHCVSLQQYPCNPFRNLDRRGRHRVRRLPRLLAVGAVLPHQGEKYSIRDCVPLNPVAIFKREERDPLKHETQQKEDDQCKTHLI